MNDCAWLLCLIELLAQLHLTLLLLLPDDTIVLDSLSNAIPCYVLYSGAEVMHYLIA